MRLSAAAVFCLAAGAALAGCPYAETVAKLESPHVHTRRQAIEGKQGIMYMNRIAPSGSQLYIANADGSNATALMGNQTSPFDYHASWSPDGEWIVFTSERRADGQADIYRVKPDGTGLETLVDTDSFEDAGVLSPDGSKLAYVSTKGNYTTNIWVMDLMTGDAQNLTDTLETRGNPASPQGHFRPSWSPDGEWIAFTSDRNTDWTGHSNGTGWEHTQSLSIYVIRPNGSDFRQIINQTGYSLATPQWSPDGTRIIYNMLMTEDTYNAHGVNTTEATVTSQIYSVDVATGTDIVALTSGDYLKVGQHYIGNSSNVGYSIKGGTPYEGINYTNPDTTHTTFQVTYLRNPSWSSDGTKLVYEIPNWSQRQAEEELFSFDSEWDYRFMDVFPAINNATNRLAITQKQLGVALGDLVTSSPTYTDLVDTFDVYNVYNSTNETEVVWLVEGTAGAFQPSWNLDGTQLVVGMGLWFAGRAAGSASVYLADANGSYYINLTDGTQNAGFPSWSPDGTAVVYRLWDFTTGAPLGLRILNFTTGETFNLTMGWDNTPGWSPDGELIVFARNINWTWSYGNRWYSDRYDVMTIRPDGTELTRLTDSLANDAHAVWTHDSRIMWNSGMYGFRDECHLYDNTFQPYGQIMIMNNDGTNKTLLTDTMWEDSMPLYVPNSYLE